MSSSRANKPDTAADVQLRARLRSHGPRNFMMIAGAGSGKTTSLVKALSTIIADLGRGLRRNRQRVACITYTEIAAGEIWEDVGSDPLIHVSTIHSFLWMITRSFQHDIKAWVLRRIDQRIEELVEAAAGFSSRVQQRTRDKNQQDQLQLEASKARVGSVSSFSYGTGSDYQKGILGHDDIIRMATDFLVERPLFRMLLAQQFPFVFVDESQDTQEAVVTALRSVADDVGPTFCLGFFGDPMQRIYPTGIGSIEPGEGWERITKEENFRCPARVLAVANAIRRGGDNLQQVGGRTIDLNGQRVPVDGTAQILVLAADNRRDEKLQAVREWVAAKNEDQAWISGDQDETKILVIVHRMAAKRLGFDGLYAAMNDKAPKSFSEGFLDSSAWPLRPFQSFVLPVTEAGENGQDFEVMTLLRKHSPLLIPEGLPKGKIPELLSSLTIAVARLQEMLAVGSAASVREVLKHLHESRLLTLDPRLITYLEDAGPDASESLPATQEHESSEVHGAAEEEGDGEEASREIASMDAFLACPAVEFKGYRQYLQQQSPFSTQQGIKGAEFQRVLVVLDDDEGTHVQFSYDKYFGVKPLSSRDEQNIASQKETSIERTRRLFYVCCTRAVSDLVVVYFSGNPEEAERCVREMEIFPDNQIFNEDALQAGMQKN